MTLVIEITRHLGAEPEYRRFESFPVTIGRGFGNDIILNDPHVDAAQLRIDAQDSGWTVTDLGAVNATEIGGRALQAARAHAASGAVVTAGGVKLRLLSPSHPINATEPLKQAGLLFRIARGVLPWIFFLLGMAAVAAGSYAAVWSDQPALSLWGAAAAAAGGMIVWSALWAVAGRLAHGVSYFGGHIAIAGLYLIAGAAEWFVSAGIAFLGSEGLAATLAETLLNGMLTVLLIYASLTLATRMTRRKRAGVAVLFAFGVTLGVTAMGMLAGGRFSPDPGYPHRLLLPLSPVARAVDADAFVTESAEIFADKSFNEKDALKP
jgi:Inner membrane component of T3SS, cytoplasmic domain